MATRMIATNLWTDREFRKIKSIKTRYLWVYLLSCTMSKSCGVFHLPLDVIAFESRLSEEDIEKSMQELEINNFCYYARDTEEIVIYNYPKYNIKNMGKPMIDCVSKELSQVSDRKLISRIIDALEDYKNGMGDEMRAELIDDIIKVYSQFVPADEKPKQEIIYLKEKTIFKEKDNNTSTITITNTNNDTLDHSCHETSNDTLKSNKVVEKVDWASKDPNEIF